MLKAGFQEGYTIFLAMLSNRVKRKRKETLQASGFHNTTKIPRKAGGREVGGREGCPERHK